MVWHHMVGTVTSCWVRRYVTGMSSSSSGPSSVVPGVVDDAGFSAERSRVAAPNLAVAMSLRADVCIAGDDSPHASGLERRHPLQVGGDRVSIAPPAYVIVRKLEYAAQGVAERHLRDIARMLERRLTAIDDALIAEFAEARGLLPL